MMEANISPVNLAGRKYKVMLDEKTSGGYFNGKTRTIMVGTEGGPEKTLEIFIHELGEALLMELALRYYNYSVIGEEAYTPNSDLLFVMKHHDWEMFAKMMAASLIDVCKEIVPADKPAEKTNKK